MILNPELWCDIASWQNDYNPNDPVGHPGKPIDFNKMRDAGAVGVVIRKSVGKNHDVWFERNWKGAGDAGLRRSVYVVPFVYDPIDPQINAAVAWPTSGGVFDGKLDIPAWDDVERKHALPLNTAIGRLLDYHNYVGAVLGKMDFYTAASVWDGFYSKAAGWAQDWELCVANYLPWAYSFSLVELKRQVAEQIVKPTLPIGWRFSKAGVAIPNHMGWRQWQISADGNGRGAEFGCHSKAVDLSFRQVPRVPGSPPDPMAQLREQFGLLKTLSNRQAEIMAEMERELAR